MAIDDYTFVASAVSGSFLLSAILKLRQPAPFRMFLDSLMGAERLKRALVVGLPALELLIGALLLTSLKPVGAVGAVATSLVFVAVAVRAIRLSNAPGCGCFGVLDAATPHWVTLVRACAMTMIAVYCLRLLLGNGVSAPTGSGFILVVGLLAGIGFALSLTLLGQVVAFQGTLRGLLVSEIVEHREAV